LKPWAACKTQLHISESSPASKYVAPSSILLTFQYKNAAHLRYTRLVAKIYVAAIQDITTSVAQGRTAPKSIERGDGIRLTPVNASTSQTRHYDVTRTLSNAVQLTYFSKLLSYCDKHGMLFFYLDQLQMYAVRDHSRIITSSKGTVLSMFVLMCMNILILSWHNTNWITNFVNCWNKYKILSNYEQSRHWSRIAPWFRCSFPCFGMLQVREDELSVTAQIVRWHCAVAHLTLREHW